MFPELAEQIAAAVEVRLAAREYDNLDEITLTELLTRPGTRLREGPAWPPVGQWVQSPGSEKRPASDEVVAGKVSYAG